MLKDKNIPKSELTQIKKVYQSTYDFERFLVKNKILSYKRQSKIIDVGTGIGSNLRYYKKKFLKSKFVGIDYSKKKISFAKKINTDNSIKYFCGDMSKKNKLKHNLLDHDLLISIHTLCCFKDLKKPIKFLCDFKTKWIAINSLFYDGPINIFIHMNDLNKTKKENNHPDSDFNIFSLKYLNNELEKNNYKMIKNQKYFPRNYIKKVGKKRGSYTMKTELNSNTVFSGPVHLPWHFILAKKI